MSELMLINPGRSGKKRKKKKRGARAKKRRPMSALQKKYFGKKSTRITAMAKKKRKKSRRRNPLTVAANPKRRRRSIRVSSKRITRRRRRNPMGLGKFNINSFMRHTLVPSAVGAAGALGLDIVLSYLPIPATMKTGAMANVVKVAGAVGLGMAVGMAVNRRAGEQVTAGAMTVILYDVMRQFLVTSMPEVAAKAGLSGMDDYPTMGYAGAGQTVDGYVSSGMGEYVDGMGVYFNDSQKVSTM